MQRIDNFFKRVNKSEKSDSDSPAPKKRKKVIISSDEEDVADSPKVSSKKTRPNDEKSSPKLSKKPNLLKLKEPPKAELKKADLDALFGGETKRVEAPKPKAKALKDLENDEIDRNLLEIDIDESLLVADSIKTNESLHDKAQKTPKKHTAGKDEKKTPTKEIRNDGEKKSQSNGKEKKTPRKSVEAHNDTKKHEKSAPQNEESKVHSKKTPTKRKADHVEQEKLRERSKSRERSTPTKPKHAKLDETPKAEKKTPTEGKTKKKESTPRAKKEHTEDLETSVLTDEERHERKRMAAALYQKFKNRASCLNPGSKEIPKGKPNCLAGLSFLVTGVLESLERDEANSIIKEYGGKVSTTVGKRLNYLIVGEEAGPKKLAQADELGIKILSVDDFFDLIRERSGEKKKESPSKPIKTEVKDEKPAKIEKRAQSGERTKPTPTKEEKKIKTEKITPEKVNSKKTEIKTEFNNNNNNSMSSKFHETKVKLEKQAEKQIQHEKPPINEEMLAWVDKYKPSSVKDIIGQQGAASNVAKLTNWLSNWYVNHDGKKKLQKPNPWAKNDDGSYYKAALLSGPPGIGKTTTANLVCKELNFDAVEFNASDTRSKRLLKEEVAELLSNKSLYGYCHGGAQAITKKHVLIMDEVDGMAGNEDRGGIQELIGLIKDSSVPIICMCNDRNHQKMRSLVNYCYDLRFQRPRVEQIKGRLMTILCRENVKLPPAKLEEIITATNNDIRQSINHISLLSANKELDLKPTEGQVNEKTAEKDMKIGPWDVVRKVFSADEHKRMTIYDKCDLFFHDYSLSPLFVQQNYLQVSPQGPKSEVLHKVALTANALSLGDLVDKRIRSKSAWTLLPTQAVFSSYMPGEFMCGHFTGQINFPGWLGKYSRTNKRSRLAQEIHNHTRLRTSGSRLSVRLDYAPFLLDRIVRPLKERGMDGVEEALNVMKEYHLLREDIDSLLELTAWPGKKQAFEAVDGRVKAALTRAYNKEVLAYSYSAAAGIKKKRAEALDEEGALLETGDEGDKPILESDDEKDDDLENDGLIKAKKKPTTSKAKGASTSKKAAGEGAKKSTSAKSKK